MVLDGDAPGSWYPTAWRRWLRMADDDDRSDERLLARALIALVEQLPFDVWVRGPDDKLIFANATARERWGAGAATGAKSSAVEPAIAEKWRTANARALAGETIKEEDVYALAGEAQTIVSVITPFSDEDGVRGTSGINLDVTGERRARAEAHRLGQVLRAVFTNTPVAMGIRAIRDDDIVHIEDNPRAAALMGSTPDALRGKTDRELNVSPEKIARAIARFREARQARAPICFEMELVDSAGWTRTLEGTALAIDDPEEETYAFVAADVSELRRLQSGLIRADRLASLGTLSASIGHEIGTSAAVALGQLEITMNLVEQGSAREDVLAGLKEAQRALLRAVGVLRDMRALAVGATLGAEISDVGAAVETVKDVLRGELDEHVILHEPPFEKVEVAMSHSRLVQILLNLMRNAIEAFVAGSGNIWIEVARPSPDRVRIDVADDGPGIPASLRERLFQPFVSTKTDGTGLGLYVCHLLATLSGGTIAGLPRDGGGTCIRLELPAAT